MKIFDENLKMRYHARKYLIFQWVKKVCGLVRIFFSETTMIKIAIHIGKTGS